MPSTLLLVVFRWIGKPGAFSFDYKNCQEHIQLEVSALMDFFYPRWYSSNVEANQEFFDVSVAVSKALD